MAQETDTLMAASLRWQAQETDLDVAQDRSAYRLLVQLWPNRLSLGIVEAGKARCLAVHDYRWEGLTSWDELSTILPSFWESHPWLQHKDWASVTLSLDHPLFTLLPASLFNRFEADLYLQTLAPVEESTDRVLYYEHAAGMVSVFAAPRYLHTWLADWYAETPHRFVHATSAWLEGFTRSFGLANSSREMILALEGQRLLVLVKEGDALQLVNYYPFRTEEDLAYYVMLAATETGLDLASDTVSLYGEFPDRLSSRSAFYRYLYPYIKHLYPGERPAVLSFSNQFDHLPTTDFYALYSLSLCS